MNSDNLGFDVKFVCCYDLVKWELFLEFLDGCFIFFCIMMGFCIRFFDFIGDVIDFI